MKTEVEMPPSSESVPEIKYSYQSTCGEKIETAINGAIEHQKQLRGWNDSSEPLVRTFLSATFDDLALIHGNRINGIRDLEVNEYVSTETKSPIETPFSQIDKLLNKRFGTGFKFSMLTRNTLALLQTNASSVAEYRRLVSVKKKMGTELPNNSTGSGKRHFRAGKHNRR